MAKLPNDINKINIKVFFNGSSYFVIVKINLTRGSIVNKNIEIKNDYCYIINIASCSTQGVIEA